MTTAAKPTPTVTLARHGETAWSLSGQHTGRSDIPLTPKGEGNALALGSRLRRQSFAAVFTSPLIRARRTCDLAGYPEAAVDADLVEWDYGELEGVTTAEFRKTRPDFNLFRDGPPGGESLAQISARADRVVARLRAATAPTTDGAGDVLVFSSGHFLRVLAARWLGLEAGQARLFALGTASVSVLGHEHEQPALKLWNDTSHLLG